MKALSLLFVAMLIAVVIVVGALSFIPALALGPMFLIKHGRIELIL